MRWVAAWLLTSTACLAGYAGPMPEIKVGTSQREMVIQGPPRLPEGGMARTFLVGTVMDVAAEVKTLPQQLELTESCTLHIDAAFGEASDGLKQVVGIKTAVLKAGYEQSPYVPAGDDWGKLWHFKQGQRLLVILHLSEGEPCFDAEELMVLDERTAALPDILRRTALLPEEFTDAELEVLRLASPYLHQQFLAETAEERALRAQKSRRRRNAMMILAGISALAVLGVFVLRKLLK
jgi:hypothetical protein